MVHCVLTPVIFAATPLLHQAEVLAEAEHGHHHDLVGEGHFGGFWLSLDLVFIALSAWAVAVTLRHVGHSGLKSMFIVSWIAFAAGLLGERLGWHAGEWLTYGGSIALICAHGYRWKRRR